MNGSLKVKIGKAEETHSQVHRNHMSFQIHIESSGDG